MFLSSIERVVVIHQRSTDGVEAQPVLVVDVLLRDLLLAKRPLVAEEQRPLAGGQTARPQAAHISPFNLHKTYLIFQAVSAGQQVDRLAAGRRQVRRVRSNHVTCKRSTRVTGLQNENASWQ